MEFYTKRAFGLSLLVAVITCPTPQAAEVIRDSPHVSGCLKYMSSSVTNTTANPISPTIIQWQAIVLLIAFGFFALLLALVHRVIRTYVYFDAHLLDTFFDAGGDTNFAVVACSVVAKWSWTAAYAWSALNTFKYGLVGQFWYAAGLAVHLFLFSIVAVEIRIKAPGAKTFLQVLYRRHGTAVHIIVMIFAIFTNIVVAGMVMTEGVNILHSITIDLQKEIISLVIALAIALFSVIGGVGGGLYVSYGACVILFSVVMVYLVEVLYDPFARQNSPLGSSSEIFNVMDCGKVDSAYDNDDNSPATFLSRGGMIEGILLILSGFSSTFVDQSFWQAGIAAKPSHTVWGFLVGGLVWFAVPFCSAFALGSAYWVWTVENGQELMGAEQLVQGLLPPFVSQRLLGNTGDFLMFTMTMAVVMTTASGEVIATASIIVYDIYQTYVSPFKSRAGTIDFQDITVRTRKAIQNEEFLEYDRRCVILKHAVVIVMSLLLIPINLVIMALGIELAYLFKFLGIVVGGCVVPISLAVTWHRVSQAGVAAGCIVGFAGGLITWLVYASTFDGGLGLFYNNTSRWEVMMSANAVSLGTGGLMCILFSLCCGGCDRDLVEEEEWEKTRAIDNPVLPWAVKYAPEFRNMKLKGIPHFYAVRRTFKGAEILAYIVGVLLTVCAILIWPACMLLAEDFQPAVFDSWALVVVIWGAVATLFIVLVPLIVEIVQTCRQVYYNRRWAKFSHIDTRPLEEDSPRPDRRPVSHVIPHDTQSFKSESDFVSTIGPDSGIGDAQRQERWKTFIHLD